MVATCRPSDVVRILRAIPAGGQAARQRTIAALGDALAAAARTAPIPPRVATAAVKQLCRLSTAHTFIADACSQGAVRFGADDLGRALRLGGGGARMLVSHLHELEDRPSPRPALALAMAAVRVCAEASPSPRPEKHAVRAAALQCRGGVLAGLLGAAADGHQELAPEDVQWLLSAAGETRATQAVMSVAAAAEEAVQGLPQGGEQDAALAQLLVSYYACRVESPVFLEAAHHTPRAAPLQLPPSLALSALRASVGCGHAGSPLAHALLAAVPKVEQLLLHDACRLALTLAAWMSAGRRSGDTAAAVEAPFTGALEWVGRRLRRGLDLKALGEGVPGGKLPIGAGSAAALLQAAALAKRPLPADLLWQLERLVTCEGCAADGGTWCGLLARFAAAKSGSARLYRHLFDRAVVEMVGPLPTERAGPAAGRVEVPNHVLEFCNHPNPPPAAAVFSPLRRLATHEAVALIARRADPAAVHAVVDALNTSAADANGRRRWLLLGALRRCIATTPFRLDPALIPRVLNASEAARATYRNDHHAFCAAAADALRAHRYYQECFSRDAARDVIAHLQHHHLPVERGLDMLHAAALKRADRERLSAGAEAERAKRARPQYLRTCEGHPLIKDAVRNRKYVEW
eukprot:TRINITY_DN30702_c0_g1_i1.p1 TRINITY_DN30702_c0_g1~~TRINITY_DN30702_c0_g1_i1.p1  ORF type:complete len:634 (+),score=120.78 TRINITY_DN30702_c0_g1_i1:194-2095(+)